MDLNSLRQTLPFMPVFVCASRHLSFSKAAEELCLTQGAVSQNIRKLEDALGLSLFHRFTRRIVLTEEGERFLGTLQKSLVDIDNELHSIKSRKLEGSLNISAPPSLANKWLAPRLKYFAEQNPDISIHLRSRNNLVDFDTEHVDLAIYYGESTHPDLNVTFLMEEQFFPVCSKDYADKYDLWNNPNALKQCLLLHDSQPWHNAQYYSEWKLWTDQMELDDFKYRRGYSFDHGINAVIVASQGVGVAIGRGKVVQDDISAGSLVVPIEKKLHFEQAYFIVSVHEKANDPRIAAFREWLLEEGNK